MISGARLLIALALIPGALILFGSLAVGEDKNEAIPLLSLASKDQTNGVKKEVATILSQYKKGVTIDHDVAEMPAKQARQLVSTETVSDEKPVYADLKLFKELTLKVKLSKRTRLGNRHFFTGKIHKESDSRVSFMIHKQVMMGKIHTQSGDLYSIRPLRRKGGLHLVQKLDRTKFPTCAVEAKAAKKKKSEKTKKTTANKKTVQVDILFLYNARAKTGAGGTTEDIEDEILTALQDLNDLAEKSQIKPRFRCVGMREVKFNDMTSLAVLWEQLKGKTEGGIDHIHCLRDKVKADLVCLWVEEDEDGTKYGYADPIRELTPQMEEMGFSVVSRKWALAGYAFAHEIGHNFGCHHVKTSGLLGLKEYSFGHVFGPTSTEYRTLMGKGDQEMSLYYSSPCLKYKGIKTGVKDEAENARTINDSADLVRDYRK